MMKKPEGFIWGRGLSWIENSNFIIEVDGGIDLKNVSEILSAGCDAFVIGSSIFGKEDITSTTVKFKNIINSGKKIIT